MLTRTRTDAATRLPGPPELLPGCPDAVIDLQTDAGVALIDGNWRYSDARVEETEFVDVGHPDDPLGPGLTPNRTFDVVPHAEAGDYDDSAWRELSPEDTRLRLSQGRVCFNWYRIAVTIPERVGDFDPTGASVVFEVTIDDYAEVWVNGGLPHALGDTGGPVVGGFNAPNRVLLTGDARPGERFQIAVFGINGPVSASPPNYIWMRTATLDFYAAERARPAIAAGFEIDRVDRALDAVVEPDATLERVASGFVFTEGPVWSGDGSLLFSSPNTNSIYRWHPSPRDRVSLQERLHRHRYRPLHPARLKRAYVRPAGPAHDLPARKPPGHPRRATWQRDRARRPLRRPSAQQPKRSRASLGRDALLH
jgi:gluconolactonase